VCERSWGFISQILAIECSEKIMMMMMMMVDGGDDGGGGDE
jgi:hypothetical protein